MIVSLRPFHKTFQSFFVHTLYFFDTYLTKKESKINFVKSNQVLGDGKFQNSESYIYICMYIYILLFFFWGGGVDNTI